MTRSTLIVSLWLLLTDGIVEAVRSSGESPLRLLFFYYAISAASAVALWLEFREDSPPAEDGPRRKQERFQEP